MEEKSQHLKLILNLVKIIFLALLFSLTLPVSALAVQPQVAAGSGFTVGLKSNGTVVAVGQNWAGQLEVGSWTDIAQVAAGEGHTVGLKTDGTVVAVGYNYYGQLEVGSWTDIAQVAAGDWHTVGVKTDGAVVAVGYNYAGQLEVGSWTDITQVTAHWLHTIGVKFDGTVVAVGDNYYGQLEVGSWTDITQVAAGFYYTVGLKSDGTVVAVGSNSDGQCNVSPWTDIVQIAAGSNHTVGVKSDGTVVAVGNSYGGQLEVGGWTDITQVAAFGHTVGVESYGTVVAVGCNGSSWCNVFDWNLIVREPFPIIIDNKDAGFSSGPSAWRSSQSIPGGYNNSYQYAPPGDGSMWAKWSFTLDSSSNYEIFAQWTSFVNRPTAAPYTIINNGTQVEVTIDQTVNGGQFISLGTYYLDAGTVEVVLNSTPAGYVIADAVKIEYRGDYERILSHIEIEGPDSVNEGSDEDYYCRAYYSDDTNAIVYADSWTDTCSCADIQVTWPPHGCLFAYELDSNEQCRITAYYTEGGVSKSCVKDITIIDTDTPEIIIDNKDAGFSSGPSAWRSSQSIPGGYNNSYQYAPPGDGSMWAKWQYTFERTGVFEVFVRWTAYGNRSTEAPYTIIRYNFRHWPYYHTVTVDQTVNGGQFISLGTYILDEPYIDVVLRNTPTGYVIADAIKLVRRGSIGISPLTADNTDPDFTKSGNWGTSSFVPGYYGTNYMYATPDGSDKWAKWTFLINEPYDYEINAQWSDFENRSPEAPYTIKNNGTIVGTATADQTQNGGRLNKLGTFFLESGNLEVILNKSPRGCVIADAVQIVPR